MGIKDITEKEYFKNNDRFSDIFNYYLFDGSKVIKSEDLVELDTTLAVTEPVNINRERDIFKKAVIKSDGKCSYLLLGIENQTRVSKDMIIRIMGYDYLSYYKQYHNVEKDKNHAKIKMYPVISLVIYYSDKKWSGPKDLHDMLGIKDSFISKYVTNVKLNLIEPNNMNTNDFNKFSNTDLSLLFEFIKYSNNKDEIKRIMSNNKKVDKETIKLINRTTNSKLEINESEVSYDMCKGMDDLRKEFKEEGLAEGRAEGIRQGKIEGIKQGKAEGIKQGKAEGIKQGKAEGIKQGKAEGIKQGKAEGIKQGKAEGIKQGKIEGIKQGKAEGIKENINTMHKNGFNIETIARALSLDIDFVKKALSN